MLNVDHCTQNSFQQMLKVKSVAIGELLYSSDDAVVIRIARNIGTLLYDRAGSLLFNDACLSIQPFTFRVGHNSYICKAKVVLLFFLTKVKIRWDVQNVIQFYFRLTFIAHDLN